MKWFRSDQCCFRFWRFEPFCAAGAVAGVPAGWGWDDVGAPPQAQAAGLESLAAGAAVAGIGVFAGSLI